MKKYIFLAIMSFIINPSYASDTDFLIENDTQVKIAREAIKKAVNDGVHPDEYFDIAFVAVRKSLKYRADTKENLYNFSQKVAKIASEEAYNTYINMYKKSN
ncbi:hypothetical protein [Acinetobacter sp. YH16053]|uniref:hypothetical protein n=1 Tax=Acinetobacter sp. YH16053 TaxID=2601192 RepID=UPI0015D244C3|nr:hypothetical protein [Acinetobacter sp. YH16053]